jgi:hypothetical protein
VAALAVLALYEWTSSGERCFDVSEASRAVVEGEEGRALFVGVDMRGEQGKREEMAPTLGGGEAKWRSWCERWRGSGVRVALLYSPRARLRTVCLEGHHPTDW